MTQAEFRRIVKSRAARIAVGASTVRNSGSAGTVAAARAHLRSLDLRPLGTGRCSAFIPALDSESERLREALPSGARHWGIARKVLNIFVRDCFYTTYLADHFNLVGAEQLFELPLDEITYRNLKKSLERGVLPKWPGVRGVTPALNTRAQEAALRVAQQQGIARVHPDAPSSSLSPA